MHEKRCHHIREIRPGVLPTARRPFAGHLRPRATGWSPLACSLVARGG